VESAIKWAFADFENLNVVADRRTLSQEDLDKLVDLIGSVRFSSACFSPRYWRRANGGSNFLVRRASQNVAREAPRKPGTGD
jgi:hypothetical protein